MNLKLDRVPGGRATVLATCLALAVVVCGTVAWLAMPDRGGGEADAIALGLFGWALFLAVALVIIWRWLCEAPFGPGYWAYTLPAAVLSVAAWQIAHATATEPARYFALALFVAANALIGFIAVRTVAALAQGRFVPR